MEIYHLHVWACGDLDESVILDSSVHPPIIKNAGLIIDSWPSDDLFYSFPGFCYGQVKINS